MSGFSYEKKWEKFWQKAGVFEPDIKKAKKPFYNLMMFPYPSAEGLHIGNMYAFVGSDIYGRFQRMQGHDVFEPIGLDGFGIHSENYALKIKKHPMKLAKISEKNFYRQLSMIGNAFAWKEKLETYDPEYYKWTQWIFIQMFKHGLAYRKKSAVNWCSSCKTVLADEQVLHGGMQGSGECERCETKVIKKELEQWFFKTTKYAEELLSDLEKIDWSEKVKIAQRNWIGKSEGTLIDFKILNTNYKIEVFTTRPDTLFGATYMVLSPEHDLISKLANQISNIKEVEEYIKKAKARSSFAEASEDKEKTGVELKGIKAINPANKEEIPIWVADYVLVGVGTGAIMAVPAHDERDFEFAKKFKLPIANVIEPTYGEPQGGEVKKRAVISIVRDPKTDKIIVLNWGPRRERHGGNMLIGGTMQDGEDLEATARREIAEETGYADLELIKKSGVVGHGHFYSNTKDHNVHVDAYGLYFELQSQTRKPVHLDPGEKDKFSVEWHPKEKVAAMLDDGIHEYFFRTLVLGGSYQGRGVLANSGKFNGMDSEKAKWEITKFAGGERKVQYRLRDWLISRQRYWGPPIPMIFCPACAKASASKENAGWQPVPEKDLPVKLPYVKNYRPKGTGLSPLATEPKFYKVRCPKCKGEARRETDVSDTFLDSAWYYLGYLILGNQKSKIKNQKFNFPKPLIKKWLPVDMYTGGAEHSVLHLLYVRFITKVFNDLGLVSFREPCKKFRAHGLIIKDGAKMSKSKGNVVSPDEYIKKFGADALRMYLMFLGPFDQGGDFRDSGILGITRFLARVQKLKYNANLRMDANAANTERILHQSIKKITEDIENLRYNTVISQLMILLNKLEELPRVPWNVYETFLQLLAPFAPYISEELWQKLHGVKKFAKKDSIHLQTWPKYDEKKIKEETFILIIQVNGKVRATIETRMGISQVEAEKLAQKGENVIRFLGGKAPRKIIFIPNKLINFVV
ncbi:MAG: class I tRNA ligase family protein [bacterium]|nr:class I tRNA ligase family protein [bacterium]